MSQYILPAYPTSCVGTKKLSPAKSTIKKEEIANFDAFVKSRKTPFSVIPTKAGIQEKQALLDPGFRRGDGFDDFLRTHQFLDRINLPEADRHDCQDCASRR
jgi:hypothetical protein